MAQALQMSFPGGVMFRPSQTDFGSTAVQTQPSRDPQWGRELTVPLPLYSIPGSLVEGPCLWGAHLTASRGDSLVMNATWH